jgi:hypothetical protein
VRTTNCYSLRVSFFTAQDRRRACCNDVTDADARSNFAATLTLVSLGSHCCDCRNFSATQLAARGESNHGRSRFTVKVVLYALSKSVIASADLTRQISVGDNIISCG